MPSRFVVLAAVLLGVGVLTAVPAAARVGVVFGFAPGFYAVPPPYVLPPPPYVYAPPPPPAYYLPPALPYPPAGYLPPTAATPHAAQQCRAGRASCTLRLPASPGDACSCDTGRGLAWGRVD